MPGLVPGIHVLRTAIVNIKLYPDADGRVGHIDVDDRTSGARLGALTQAASGFAIRPGAATAGGMHFAAVPITIPAQQIARDRGFVGQVHLAQTAGRQIVIEQRDFRRANPTALSRIPRPAQPPQQQQLRPTTTPGQLPQRPNGQPRPDNRPGQQQPGTPSRQGLQQGVQPPQRQGQGQHGGTIRPGTPRVGQQQHLQPQPAQPQGAGRSRAPQSLPQRGGQIQPGGIVPPQLGGTQQAGPQQPLPRTGLQPGQPAAQQQGMQRPGGFQPRLPAAQRPAVPRRSAPAPEEKGRR
ncbi:hypothetical protein ABH999_004312 [Bradyrhizobium yuanmingense]|uniref:hypothetical protein n=1 Tax=Bradyrhizobium yuanmingense TaxID=108015 RepID=UPI0004AEFC24